jgi:hypothetical protein
LAGHEIAIRCLAGIEAVLGQQHAVELEKESHTRRLV